MKQIKRHFHVIIVMLGLITMISCEDLAFGDKFLQKPPSTDVTIDTVFSTAEYARRVIMVYLSVSFLTDWKQPDIGQQCICLISKL